MTAATEVSVPDLGDFSAVPIIEVHVSPGDRVNAEDPLITLESDKAAMDVPAPFAGTVTQVLVAVGDEVSEGTPILHLTPGDGAVVTPPSLIEQQEPDAGPAADQAASSVQAPAVPAPPAGTAPGSAWPTSDADVHAGPSVRRTARELDIDLAQVVGTGPNGRITLGDLRAAVSGPPVAPAPPAAGAGIPEVPVVDFATFGPIREEPLTRIKKISGPVVHRSWLNVPHVTHSDEADITELDAYRQQLDTATRADGYRVTLLAFLVKASVSALKTFPEFNSSLNPDKDGLILKDYYNVGIAVDTPDGLVVPVVHGADRKGILELSKEFGGLSGRAREGKLTPSDMQGATFTISSLGGIGGTSFTPIVNAPEVAILGVVRSVRKPVWNGEEFVPRLMLPISLSYDHRVIDGALAARFARRLCYLLEDDRRLLH